jgi:hypothetical protein
MKRNDYLAQFTAKGVRQSQIAREAGSGQATISDLAPGKTRVPRTSPGMAPMRTGVRFGIKPTGPARQHCG